MYGGIDARIIFDVARSKGVYTQLSLDLRTPLWVFVDPEHLTSVPKKLSYHTPDGGKYGMYSSIDHPSFTNTREWLGSQGYIKIENGWINGDRVLKPFYFNNVLLTEGEKFACGSAMYYHHHKNYNDGEPDYTVKNYKKDVDIW